MKKRYASPDLIDLLVEQWAREMPDLDVSSLGVLARLHRCEVHYQALIGEVLGRYGLTVAAFDVLASLRRSGPTYERTAGELAKVGLISSGGLTQRIDKLEAEGLVVRRRNPGDRRVVRIALTDAGRELIDEVVRAHFANQDRLLVGLSAAERKQLGGLLGRLEQSLDLAAVADPTRLEDN